MQRYFLDMPYEKKTTYHLTGEQYHHIARVMRMSQKDQVFLVFTNQCSIVAEIIDISANEIVLVERDKEKQEKELPVHVTIACGYPKGDKLEWIIQKATELGAASFLGFPSTQSIVKWDDRKRNKKQERLAKIALEAAEQSQRQSVPKVELLNKKEELFTCFEQFNHVLVAYEESAKKGEKSALAETLSKLNNDDSLLVIFGPEGGFSVEEIIEFEVAGAKICGLGPRILRAETAPLYLLSVVSYQFELI